MSKDKIKNNTRKNKRHSFEVSINNDGLDYRADNKGYMQYEDIDYKSEIWKKIEVTPEYEISNLGRVRNKNTKYILRPLKDKDGYLRLLLRNKGYNKVNTIIIHQWVARCFLKKKAKKELVVNHINEIKQDNRFNNLEWVTQSENTNHGTRNEKASEALSEPILLVSRTGERFYFDSCSSLERVTDGIFTRKGSSSAKNRKGVHRGFQVLKYDGGGYDYTCSEEVSSHDLYKNIEHLLSMADSSAMRPNAKVYSSKDPRKPIIGTNIITGKNIKYNSTAEAVDAGFGRSNIIAVIKGKRNSHKGYKWHYDN